MKLINAAVIGILAIQCQDVNSQLVAKELKSEREGVDTVARAVFSRCPKNNDLEWKDSFYEGGTGYIDGIAPPDLKSPVQCGIDPWGRAYIAFKYTCIDDQGEAAEGAAAIFERYKGGPLVYGGHYMPKGCPGLGSIDPDRETFEGSFPLFLAGEPVPYRLCSGAPEYTLQLM